MAMACTAVGWTNPCWARLLCRAVERERSEKLFILLVDKGNQRAGKDLKPTGGRGLTSDNVPSVAFPGYFPPEWAEFGTSAILVADARTPLLCSFLLPLQTGQDG